ncbi:MAG: hypothetical protein C5B50_05365 [Verrucomicrobia bacterium]|nr:MAG: hypothetical protein C5B50_05365 [Verrucomicrobiota bacterium]
MPLPSGNDVSEFSYRHIWDSVIGANVPERLNARVEFASFLKTRGCVAMVADEYAEKNIDLILTKILIVCGEWESLGIPCPLHVTDQHGAIVTWKHPKFGTISGRATLPQHYCDVWQWVRSCYEREFLFCCATYLFLLGCTRIFITDTSGDAGLDLIGIHEKGPFKGVCFLVQAKTAQNEVSKETLFSDYTKFLLLRHSLKWHDYQKAVGIDKAADGIGLVYIFASNLEFNPAIVEAAKNLPIVLRSGRHLAYTLSLKADLNKWSTARTHVGALDASLTRNLYVPLSQIL